MVRQYIIDNSAKKREELFISLYKKAFPVVAKYVIKKGGDFDDAKDIFQDALMVYYEKVINGSIILNSNEQAYLMGIAKHLWSKKFKENIKHTTFDGSNADFVEEDDIRLSSDKLMYYLETTGQKCLDILRAFYYDNLPVAKIAEVFGYSGVRSSTVQKYKCMEKVRETIKETSLAYEDFIE
jgi:DNA-directed RNA polymerase specialized sigma24 family protein